MTPGDPQAALRQFHRFPRRADQYFMILFAPQAAIL